MLLFNQAAVGVPPEATIVAVEEITTRSLRRSASKGTHDFRTRRRIAHRDPVDDDDAPAIGRAVEARLRNSKCGNEASAARRAHATPLGGSRCGRRTATTAGTIPPAPRAGSARWASWPYAAPFEALQHLKPRTT